MNKNTGPIPGLSTSGKSNGRRGLFVVLAAVSTIAFAGMAGYAGADEGISAPSVSNNVASLTNLTAASVTFSSSETRPYTFECSTNGTDWSACTSPLALTGLSDGSHTVSVRQVVETSPAVPAVAADPEGCTPTVDCTTDPVAAVPATYETSLVGSTSWTVDTAAPAAPELSGDPAALTNSRSASVSASAESGATLTCSVDGGAYEACNSPKTLSDLADGSHSVAFKATDAAGNTSSAATASWTVDATAPAAPQLSGSPASLTNSKSALISISGEEGATFSCSIDGGDAAACSSISLSDLADGSHGVSVTQTDAAGNTGSAASASWTVDTAAPAAPALSGTPAALVNTKTASISASAEEGSTLTCSVDGGAYAACTSPLSLSDLADGDHTVSVKATDAAGNTGEAATATWTVDTIAPAKPVINGAPSGVTKSTSANVTVSADIGATLTCSVNGGEPGSCAGLDFTGLTDGPYSLSVTATDAAGNTSSAATASWTVDTTAPSAPELSGAPASLTNSKSASINVSAEAGASLTCSIDGGDFEACTSPVTRTDLADGSHSVAVKATDAAGNTSPAATANWTVDATAPAAPELSGAPASLTNSRSASVSASAESGATLTCSVDGGAYGSCDSPKSLSDLADGSHSVAFKATDAAGNTSSAATASWTVDATAPAAPGLSGAPTGRTKVTSASISISGEEGATFSCSIDGGDAAACTGISLSDLADGSHGVSVTQTDAAGNTSAAASASWTVDTAAPAAPELSGAPASLTKSTSASISASAEEGANLTCSIDGGDYAACTSPISRSDLSDGSHSVAVKATDAAGNTSSAATASWTVDATAPAAPGLSGAPTGRTKVTSASISISGEEGATFSCSIDGGDAAACTGISLSDLADGTHTVAVTQTDAAGNTGSAAAASWVVDTAAPAAPLLTGAPSALTNNTSASINISGEADATFSCSVDGGEATSCKHISLSSLADGAHSVSVTQTDVAGNTSSAATASWTVDATAPAAPSLSNTPPALTNHTSESIGISAEAGATLTCKVDGQKSICSGGSISLSGLADGAHTIIVEATDAAGNTSAAATVNWTVDATNPAPPVLSGAPSAFTNATGASIGFSHEDEATFTCSIDGGDYEACSTPLTRSDLADGEHSVAVKQTDVAGNTSAAATATWTVDTGVPAKVSLSGIPAEFTQSKTASITIAGEDNAVFHCSVDGGTAAACTGISLSDLADGTHTVSVTQTDRAGNTSAPESGSWTVDTAAPAAPGISGAPAAHTQSRSANITLSGEDHAVLHCSVDGGEAAACTEISLSDLADGDHNISVTQTDRAGNVSSAATASWNVDNAAPAQPLLSGKPADYTQSRSASINIEGEANATFTCSVDLGEYAACTSPKTLSDLADGEHSVSVKATDRAGNTSLSSTVAWTVDNAAPEAPVLSGKPADYTQTRSASIAFSGEEHATFTCSVDGGDYGSCSSPKDLSELADGAHSVAVKATDRAGNSSAAGTVSWTVDNIAPDAPVLSGVPGALVATRAASIGLAAEDHATFTCSVDGGDYGDCASPKELSGLTDGNHSISVKATDRAGNTSSATTSSTWEVDGTAPVIALGGVPTGGIQGPAPSGYTNAKKPAWFFTLNDAAGHLAATTATCRVDSGTTATACTSPYQAPVNLADGSHTLTVTVEDSLGNSRTYTNAFTVDTIAPTTSIIDGPSGRSGANVSFRFGTTEEGATFRCRATGANAFSWRSCNSTESLTGLSSGATTLYVQSTDAAGNQSLSVSRTWSVSADVPTAVINYRTPTTTVGSYPLGVLRVGNGEFRFLVDDPLATTECKLDDEPWAECTSPYTYSGLGYGDHTFSVRATNDVGTVGATKTSSWTVAGEPDTTIGSKPDANSHSNSATFGFSSSYPGATFQCKLDSGSWIDCSSGTVTYTSLALLGHTVQVRAVNQLGEADLTPATYNWTVVDIPNTIILTNSPGTTFDTSLSVAFGSTYPGATFQCSLDNAAWAACTNPKALSGLTAGTHTFRVRALNSISEADETPASLTWTVATAETTIGTKPAAAITARTASFTFSSNATGATFECKLDAGAWAACVSPRNLSDLALGSHTFQVRATKNGLTDATPASYTFSVNAPDTTIGSTKPAANTTDTTPSFSFASDTTGATFECKLDSGSWASCTSPKSYSSALSVGSHTFQVRASAFGATDATPASYTWTIGAPDTSITAKPAATDTDRTPSFSFTSTVSGSTYECKIDSGSWKTCKSPYAVTSDLSLGSHTFQVRASDNGLTDATPASYTWTIGCPIYPAVNVSTSAVTVATGLTAQVNVQFAKPVAGDSTGMKFSLLLNGGAGTTAQKAAFANVVKSIDVKVSSSVTKTLTSSGGWLGSYAPSKDGSYTLTITFKKASGTLGTKTVTVNVNPACS